MTNRRAKRPAAKRGVTTTRVMGKVKHWGKVSGRVHMLHAIVGPNVKVGDVFIVHVVEAAKCPNWSCGGDREAGPRRKGR